MNKTLRTNLTLRWFSLAMAVMVLFSATVAQPTHALGIINTIKCGAIQLFSTTSTAAMQMSKQAMLTSFQLQLNIMEGSWKLEDLAVDAFRQVGESIFNATLTAFQNRPGIFIKQTEFRTAAVEEYRTTMLDALHLHQTNIDAARASYREDMMALVKAHQKALTDIVDVLITTITNATQVALAHCSDNGVVFTLIGIIAQANAQLIINVVTEDVKSIAKAFTLVATRNTAFAKEALDYTGTSVNATIKLAQAFLTRQ